MVLSKNKTRFVLARHMLKEILLTISIKIVSSCCFDLLKKEQI